MVVRFLLVFPLSSSDEFELEDSSAKRSSRCFILVTLALSFFVSFAVVMMPMTGYRRYRPQHLS